MSSMLIPRIKSVTIAASGVAQKIFGAGPYPKILALTVQNGTLASVNLGDSTVSNSTGINIATNGAFSWTTPLQISSNALYLSGTINSVISVTYLEII